jgi:predicted dehydrogenase
MVSRHHLIAWSHTPLAEVVAIADPQPERLCATADEWCIPVTGASLDEILSRSDVDVIDIATPVATHGTLVREAAQHGLNVICQKPLAPTIAEAEAILASVSGRIRLVVHENWRYRAPYRQISAWLRDGRIGRVAQFALTYYGSGHVAPAGSKPPALVRQPFMADLERLLVFETLIHHLDVLWYLFGPLTLHAARLSRVSPSVRGEDGASLLLTAGQGHGTVSATTSAPVAGATAADSLLIVGTAGAISVEGHAIQLAQTDGFRERIEFERAEVYQGSYNAAVAHYASCLAEDRPFESPPEEHLEILRLAEAVYAAAGVLQA